MTNKSLLISILFVFNTSLLFSQNNQQNWLFGKNTWLQINENSSLSFQTGSLMDAYYEGSASISDQNEELLFYSNGKSVWRYSDGTHELLQNGTNLKGNESSTQTVLFVQNPSLDNIYYIFTIGSKYDDNGLYVSTIDIHLDNGKGAIVTTPSISAETSKNKLLSNTKSEKLIAVTKCSPEKYWVISYDHSTKQYMAFEINGNGINTQPVNSISSLNQDTNTGEIGQIAINNTGDKIATAFFNPGSSNVIEVMDFDYSTGELTNSNIYPSMEGTSAYGVAFSPNGTLLYYTILRHEGNGLYQIDLATGFQTMIYQSALPSILETSSLRIGVDDKIYVAIDSITEDAKGFISHGRPFIGVIDDPNKTGTSCDFNPTAIELPNGMLCRRGLPNFINYNSISGEMDIGSDTLICHSDYILSASENFDSYQWQDGSTASNFTVTEPGIYSVIAIKSGCTFTDSVEITFGTDFTVNLGDDQEICSNQELTLISNIENDLGDHNYLWQDGSTAPFFTAKHPGIYSLTVYNDCYSHADTIEIKESMIQDIFMPNAITPNNDGLNDNFEIDERLLGSKIWIYNRWGRLIYKNKDYQNDWQADNLSTGVYFYLLKNDCHNNTINGTINILR